jgi:hypothetical protein
MRKRTPSQKPPHRVTLKTVASVIKAFGGEAEIAAWASTDQPYVRQWKRWGSIPVSWQWRMAIRLAVLGYEADPKVFGLDDVEVWKEARPSAAYSARRLKRPRARS